MKNRPFRLAVLAFCSVTGLSACVSSKSFMYEGYQPVAFTVQGVDHANCYAYAGNIKYYISAPQTVNVKKSREDLRVTCMSGNRTVDLNVPAAVDEKAVWAGSSGVSGGFDTKVLYSYPPAVNVDFGVFAVAPVSSVPLEEDSAEGETAVGPHMLPDVPVESSAPVAPAKTETKGSFMNLLHDLGTKSGNESASQDGDVVEMDPKGAPVSLSAPQ